MKTDAKFDKLIFYCIVLELVDLPVEWERWVDEKEPTAFKLYIIIINTPTCL